MGNLRIHVVVVLQDIRAYLVADKDTAFFVHPSVRPFEEQVVRTEDILVVVHFVAAVRASVLDKLDGSSSRRTLVAARIRVA